MRSNKNQATRFLLRRNLFIGVIVFLVAFYMMPFWGLSHIPNETAAAREFVVPEAIEARLAKIVSSEVMTSQLNLEMMVILYGWLGFMTATILMGHLFSRRQSMLHAALPDRRGTDFLRRCAAYAVLCLAPIVLNFLLYLLVVAANGMLAYVAWDVLLPKFGLLLLINLYGFAMGMLSSVLTGTYWAAVLAGAVLIVGMEALAALWYWLGTRYLYTLTQDSFMNALLHVSPAASLYKGFYKPAEWIWLPGVVAIVLALALSFALYRIRRTERAEHTLAFAPLHGILGFLLPLLGGTFLGIVVKLSFETEVSLIVGMVLGTVLTFWVCRMIFCQRFCGILAQWALLAASATVLLLGVAVLHTDALGYDRFLPDRDALTAITYRPSAYNADERVTLRSAEALDAAYAWCTLMRDEVSGYESGFADTAGAFGNNGVVVTYRMGGREVIRRYPNRTVRTEAQDSLRRIIESDDYRQSLVAEYHLDAGDVTEMYLNPETAVMQLDAFYERFGMVMAFRSFSRADESRRMDELLSALKADVLSRTFEEKQGNAILSADLYIESAESGPIFRSVPVYPGDENFLKAVFGDRAAEVVDYVTGGYADSEDIAVLKVDYAQTRRELGDAQIGREDAVQSITEASGPAQAMAWIRQSQYTTADEYYYMPCVDDAKFAQLFVYRMSEVQKYADVYQYEVPEDRTQLYREPMITEMLRLDYMGEN